MKPKTVRSLYHELESNLATSTGTQRVTWASTIVQNDISVKQLSRLLLSDEKTATLFRWLVSDIASKDPERLRCELPFLLRAFDQLDPACKTSFANYWLIAGVPAENEAEAIGLLFQWLLSNETNVTIKSRSLLVLFHLAKKYPELKNELKIALPDQADKYTRGFKRKVEKIFRKLDL